MSTPAQLVRRFAPAGIPFGIALWLVGAHAQRYAPTVLGLALVAFSLYAVLYPPRPVEEE